MRAAYIHVVADAATSVAAIAALLVARYFHVVVVDPIAGIAGAVLVCTWGVGLLRDAGRVLLDREKDTIVIERIRRTLEQVDHTKVTDLHVMRVSRDTYACIVVVVAKPDRSVADFRELLLQNPEIVHTTIEIARS